MSEIESTTAKPGPPLAGTVQEVRGIFPNDAALQDAIGRLARAGFDRAEISLPVRAVPPGAATPEQGAENPNTEDDDRQMRTLHASMAGSAAALLAAGAVIGTGGAAAPAVAAAVAAGLAAGGAAHAVSREADSAQHERREMAAMQGELVLAARVTTDAKRRAAEAAMQQAGASRIEPVLRT